MQIRSLTVGPIATCCYILSREDRPDCLVIDPGAEPERILRAAGEKRIAAILLTHGHFDHIEAVAALKGEDTPVLIHELDAPMLGDPDLNVSRPLMHRDITDPPVWGLGPAVLEGQDWVAWNDEGLLDGIYTMNYHTDPEFFRSLLDGCSGITVRSYFFFLFLFLFI